MLATEWLLRDRGAREVELRIARGNSASQRVATKAGYRLVGEVSDVVEVTGNTYDDFRYVRAAGRTIGQPPHGPHALPG
jgi:RimJ/RimL family protein N-acetyltransferase